FPRIWPRTSSDCFGCPSGATRCPSEAFRIRKEPFGTKSPKSMMRPPIQGVFLFPSSSRVTIYTIVYDAVGLPMKYHAPGIFLLPAFLMIGCASAPKILPKNEINEPVFHQTDFLALGAGIGRTWS